VKSNITFVKKKKKKAELPNAGNLMFHSLHASLSDWLQKRRILLILIHLFFFFLIFTLLWLFQKENIDNLMQKIGTRAILQLQYLPTMRRNISFWREAAGNSTLYSHIARATWKCSTFIWNEWTWSENRNLSSSSFFTYVRFLWATMFHSLITGKHYFTCQTVYMTNEPWGILVLQYFK
jgi:hypothetical protein